MHKKVIVIGAGPVGIKAVEEIATHCPETEIVLYGDELVNPYNRVLLSNYLAGKDSLEAIQLKPKVGEKQRLQCHYNCAITGIDPVAKTVTRADGLLDTYDKLVLATGSHAYVPKIDQAEMTGTYTLRTLADADALMARKSRVTVVLGGGLLGLETARALYVNGGGKTRVIVVDHSINLMNRQLNKAAGDLLMEKVIDNGIEVILDNGVKEIHGNGTLEAIKLRNNQVVDCDTLVFAVGIRPNVQLAGEAGLQVRLGVVVNARLQTSNPDIYAVGECAEFAHITYGIVAPGYEQAKIMAVHLCGLRRKMQYRGSILATNLKVLDYQVFSMGSVGENESGAPMDRYTFAEKDKEVYRHLILDRRQLIGCIAMGEWSELNRVRSAIENRRKIWPWQLRRFHKTGLIWADQAAESVVYWPDSEIVCNCNQITRGEIGQAVMTGCNTIPALSGKTEAGSTCGSCHSLLSELLGCRVEPVKAFRALIIFSILAFLGALTYFLTPAIPYQDMATTEWHFDELWRDNFLKQVTGYTLLGSSVMVLTLSLRKRLKELKKGDFAYWRIMHVSIGVLTIITLLAHTGFSFGSNLNLYLMISFLGLLMIGGLAGLVIGFEHQLNPGLARTLRSQFIWGHILLFWPLPVLLCFHILQTYYF